ncbi:hypothetical protein Agub_g5391, partial [Astrephomene gubernaculifera]
MTVTTTIETASTAVDNVQLDQPACLDPATHTLTPERSSDGSTNRDELADVGEHTDLESTHSQTSSSPKKNRYLIDPARDAKFNKALAPYVDKAYWCNERALQITREYLSAHPPPEDESDLPAYISSHLRDLQRVTSRWAGCVGGALDTLAHQLAVDERLERQRHGEEGRHWEAQPPGEYLIK